MPSKIVYLTIDDGPTPDLPGKLAFLQSRAIPAVLFCRGDQLEARPRIAIDAIRAGFVVGNHAYDHPQFSTLTLEQAGEQIRRTELLVESLYQQAGVPRPGRFFRFPYGDRGRPEQRPAFQDLLGRLGFTQPGFAGITYPRYHREGRHTDLDWHWTFDLFEWSIYAEQPIYGIDSLAKVLARIDEDRPDQGCGLNDPRSEDIILTHDHVESTEIFVPILERLIAKDLVFRLPDL